MHFYSPLFYVIFRTIEREDKEYLIVFGTMMARSYLAALLEFDVDLIFLFQLVLDYIYLHVTLITLSGCSFCTTLSLCAIPLG